MGIFKALKKTILIPVDVVKDVATLGGTLTDKKETYTGSRLEDIGDELDKWADD